MVDKPKTDIKHPLPVDGVYRARQQGCFAAEDGTPIYYEISGEGRPLLFCYGLVCRREHWRHQLDHFCKDYQVILFDYRGHQRSGIPANDHNLTLEWCARDGIALLKHLNLKEATVMGHSMGVPVAALIGEKQPDLIKGLVLICGTVTNPFDGMFNTNRLMTLYQGMEFLYGLAPGAMAVIWRRLTELNRLNFFLTSRLGFNPYLAEEQDVLRYMEGVNRTPLQVFFTLISDYVSFDGRDRLGSIQAPTLVVAGNEDQITPLPLQEEMVRLLPNGTLEKIPMGSHNAHMDVPEMVNERIEHFLKKIEYT